MFPKKQFCQKCEMNTKIRKLYPIFLTNCLDYLFHKSFIINETNNQDNLIASQMLHTGSGKLGCCSIPAHYGFLCKKPMPLLNLPKVWHSLCQVVLWLDRIFRLLLFSHITTQKIYCQVFFTYFVQSPIFMGR